MKAVRLFAIPVVLSVLGALLALERGAFSDDHPCPDGQHWDSSMNMCMPDATAKTSVDFHVNAFLVGGAESGPRGRDAVDSPNMWMIDLNHKISDQNLFKVEWMGTAELWTVPKDGVPELLQIGENKQDGTPYVDAQHPHSSPVMGLTFEDIIQLHDDHQLTFFFAPRGEATAGVPPFMHRASAEGNPNVPLGHHIGQDVFHVSSTVIGAKYETDKTTVAVSAFSGREPQPTEVNLDMHKPDSVGVSVSHKLNDDVTAGASFAEVENSQQATGNLPDAPQPQSVTSAWVSTQSQIKSVTLSTSSIFGQVYNHTDHQSLNSFLEEFVATLGNNNFFGRVEVLQRTPGDLQIQVTDGKTGAQWVKAVTLGYERKILQKDGFSVFAGASYTKDFVPGDFKAAYGGNPNSGEVHIRLNFMKHKDFGPPEIDHTPRPKYAWFRRSVIAPRCMMCHSTTQGDGDGLISANFETYEGVVKMLKPGDPLHSTLYIALLNKKMPRPMEGMENPQYLSDEELGALFDWIADGAKKDW
jgi:hypothetical protein